MRILLIAGGWSSERDVSLKSKDKIAETIISLGHTVTHFDPAENLSNLLKLAKEHDFAFIGLYGSPGEDGIIQALLKQANCPFQGTHASSSLLALNKAATKMLLEEQGLKTPHWTLFTPHSKKETLEKFPLPVVVKPNCGGSSIGINIAFSYDELFNFAENILAVGETALVEQYLQGIELTCPVLENKALPALLIRPKNAQFFDYETKYNANMVEELCPAPISKELEQELREKALQVHKILKLKDYSRTDFLLINNELIILEVNTLPGLTPTSLLPKSAQTAGISYAELCEKLINLGLQGQ